MAVYLLCFHKKYHHARHYIGFTETKEGLDKRMERHRKGQGARLIEVISKAGIGFDLVRTWPNGDRNFERKLKNQKNASLLCPTCKLAATRARLEKKLAGRGTPELKAIAEKAHEPMAIVEQLGHLEHIEDSYADHMYGNPRLNLRTFEFNFDKMFKSAQAFIRKMFLTKNETQTNGERK